MARAVFFEALCPVNFGRSRRQICCEDPFFLVFYQILEVTVISGQKVGNLRLISGEDIFFLEITIIAVQKVGIPRLISGENFFFMENTLILGGK